MMTGILQDFRYAVRQLRKSPGFTAIAVITLALWIGANTAVFSAVSALLLHPQSFPDMDRLVLLREGRPSQGEDQKTFAPADLSDLTMQTHSFEQVAAFRFANFNLTWSDGEAGAEGAVVSANFFHLLGVDAAIGRTFDVNDAVPGREQEVLISHRYWLRQFVLDRSRATNFYRQLEDRFRALPGVQSVSMAYSVPMGSYSQTARVMVEGHPQQARQQPPVILFNAVDSAYFQTMKIPLLRGRSFTDSDNEGSVHVAIVTQTLAEQLWPNEDALGKRFTSDETKGTFWQVIGIAQNGKYGVLAEAPQPYFYLPIAQKFMAMRVLELRTSIPPEALILPVQQQIKNLDPGLPIFLLRTMTDSLAGANGFMIFRMGALLASSIGAMGLTMAVVGVYGVVAFAASQRTREIGIRIALGANRTQVLKLVVRQGVWVVLAGAALGLLVAIGISRQVANLLLGVSATDPLTFITATAVLLVAALYACFVPARRAMNVDPMVALRYE